MNGNTVAQGFEMEIASVEESKRTRRKRSREGKACDVHQAILDSQSSQITSISTSSLIIP